MTPPPTPAGEADPAQRPALPGAIYHAAPADAAALEQAAAHARALGFDALCLAAPLPGMADAARRHGLRLLLEMPMDAGGPAADPTAPPDPRFPALHRPPAAHDAQGWLEQWENRLIEQAGAGVEGFLCALPAWAGAEMLRNLVAAVKGAAPGTLLVAATPAPRADLVAAGFDAVAPLLPWTDALDQGAGAWAGPLPLLALAELPGGRRLANRWSDRRIAARALRRAIRLAALSGAGWLLPAGLEAGALHRGSTPPPKGTPPRLDLAEAVREANAERQSLAALAGGSHPLSAPHAPVALLRQGPGKAGRALVLANASLTQPRRLAAGQMLGLLPQPGALPPDLLDAEGRLLLAPAEVRIVPIHESAPVRLPLPEGTAAAEEATASPRIAIENIAPAVDGGRFAVKRGVGQAVTVTADVFTDGHTKIAVRLLWRPADEEAWREVPMTAAGNDVWQASFVPERIGRHLFTVEAWVDVYAAFVDEITKKHAAGVDIALERREGVALLQAASGRLAEEGGDLAMVLENEPGVTHEQAVALFTLPRTIAAMRAADARPFLARQDPPLPLDVERREAGFASWYEIFPRSQSGDPNRHGTFHDVIARLPAIREMGFDVLYFPPIHPIGQKNRKGRNNSLTPQPGDPGSPYAIGSEAGGHDALHPELGTLEDFRALVRAAAGHGMELALDFAIQCSPDHPWLRDHPDWFDWRPDGSIRYAENPPKKYEDIVNVDFYKPGAMPALWLALRDVVLFWVKEGVKLFRVDNPHTKPLPFWEWMIGEVRARAPEAVFLSEAFTRPKVMYRLAKVGFSQSYTYFTWRNTRLELQQYLQELNQPPVRDFFRPHFFVNTPDINPEFLQHSGRPGHLIRAALAATLSGLWGVYNGFELCEATPVAPGKEEYLDSEKYEIKAWDYDRPGNIKAEITRLNQIRRENPALHTHLGTTFLNAQHDGILLFVKQTPERENVVLVAISMDPRNAAETWMELPQWAMGLPNGAPLAVENLMPGGYPEERWDGTHRFLRLDPNSGLPFAIWRLRAADKA